jgi:hypothetical protein
MARRFVHMHMHTHVKGRLKHTCNGGAILIVLVYLMYKQSAQSTAGCYHPSLTPGNIVD